MAQQIDPSSLEGIKILGRVNQRVGRAAVTSRETESIAEATLDELAHQRDALGRTRDRVTNANKELDETNKRLGTIHMRILTSRLLLGAIILLEIIIIALQLYLKFGKNHK